MLFFEATDPKFNTYSGSAKTSFDPTRAFFRFRNAVENPMNGNQRALGSTTKQTNLFLQLPLSFLSLELTERSNKGW